MADKSINKSTVAEIKARFDQDVARFSNLETGQLTTIDATITMELCTDAALSVNPDAINLLDIGCGAGNYTIKLLEKIPGLNCTLVDLSMPMLEKALERVSSSGSGQVEILQSDIRTADLPDAHFDVIFAAAVLHHLRDDQDWEAVFTKLYRTLKPGGSMWISDLITHDSPALSRLFNQKYADYLDTLGGEEYRQNVLAYIEKEDSPRSIDFQLDLMKKVGFRYTEVLHKNGSFAAFGGVK